MAIGTNLIIARDNTLGAVLNSPIFALLKVPNIEDTIGSVVVANDIENIIGGSGSTQIFLHSGAVLQGTLSAKGKLTIDYSDYLSAPLKEQQQLTVGSGVTGTLSLSIVIDPGTGPVTKTTSSITIGSDASANATAIQSALNDSSVLGVGAVTVVASPYEAGTYVINFTAAGNFSQISVSAQSLVNASAATATAATTTLVNEMPVSPPAGTRPAITN